jgi:hypothetical protein
MSFYLFIYLFKVRSILDPMCCYVRRADTLSYYTLHGAVASGVADIQQEDKTFPVFMEPARSIPWSQ